VVYRPKPHPETLLFLLYLGNYSYPGVYVVKKK
jgi:hypothetical protein